MADLTIQHLRYIARHVKITAEMIECGDGWLYLVDELLAELPQGTVVERIADVDGRLQVTATGEPVVTHMVSAAWRRSATICPRCGEARHSKNC